MYHIQQGFMQFFPQVPHFANSDQSRQRYTQKIQSPNFGLCPCTKKPLCYIQLTGEYNFSVANLMFSHSHTTGYWLKSKPVSNGRFGKKCTVFATWLCFRKNWLHRGLRQTSWLFLSQAWPRSWTWDYQEQIQLAVRVGIELRASRLQFQCSNRSATLH